MKIESIERSFETADLATGILQTYIIVSNDGVDMEIKEILKKLIDLDVNRVVVKIKDDYPLDLTDLVENLRFRNFYTIIEVDNVKDSEELTLALSNFIIFNIKSSEEVDNSPSMHEGYIRKIVQWNSDIDFQFRINCTTDEDVDYIERFFKHFWNRQLITANQVSVFINKDKIKSLFNRDCKVRFLTEHNTYIGIDRL